MPSAASALTKLKAERRCWTGDGSSGRPTRQTRRADSRAMETANPNMVRLPKDNPARRWVREQQGRQHKVAELMGVTASWLSHAIRGNRPMTREQARSLDKAIAKLSKKGNV